MIELGKTTMDVFPAQLSFRRMTNIPTLRTAPPVEMNRDQTGVNLKTGTHNETTTHRSGRGYSP